MRVNQGQEFVIAGYTPSPKNFDALVIGYYESNKLMFAARTRNGFTPGLRVELFKKIKPLEIEECRFANPPEKKSGRWGAGLTAAKMAERRWSTPIGRAIRVRGMDGRQSPAAQQVHCAAGGQTGERCEAGASPFGNSEDVAYPLAGSFGMGIGHH
jgi:hypothetical protein